jgi:hypothetical protein
MTSLDERIASAFRDGMTSGDVADLIQQAETAAVACGEAAEVARSQALNPALCAADVAGSAASNGGRRVQARPHA